MSKYFLPPIVPKRAPTLEERMKDAIIDLEKRVNILEKREEDRQSIHHAEEFAKARAYERAKEDGRL